VKPRRSRSTTRRIRSTTRRIRSTTRRRATRRSTTRRHKKSLGGSDKKKKVVVKSFNKDKDNANLVLKDEINNCDGTLLKLYMNGCIHCENMKETWKQLCNDEELEKYCGENNFKLGVFEVEVNEYNKINDKFKTSEGVPHIIYVNKDVDEPIVNTFDGERSISNLTDFVKKSIANAKKKPIAKAKKLVNL